ncbi:PEP-utilizing enzyme [Actinomadura rudentiformis]|uniref:PEP-utilising enzyme mobile domain-containing protein n=1 Tax=Actinomadura rudentiformis TaxID=359158 RepID=A0A6H9YI62_9ACTN|nr:PEP-utilizing enzyme [Actinomadura rudentiformis]KAB2340373.1 hypothetical protein F8566_45110 [Actinomadura rudentiformis]
MVTRPGEIADSFVTDWRVSERLPHYTRANAGEVLPDPASPLGWTLVFEQGLLKGWRRGFIDFGVDLPHELDTDRPQVAGMFGGYFYLNLSHMRLMAIRMGSTVEAFDAALLGSHPDVPPYEPQAGDQSAECAEKAAAGIVWAMTAEAFPEIDADRERAQAARDARPDLGTLSDAELVARMRSFLPELDNAFYRHDYSTLASTVAPAVIGQILASIGREDLLLELLSGWGEVDSAAPSFALWDLGRRIAASPALTALMDEGAKAFAAELESAEPGSDAAVFGKELDRFLHRFGCRGPNEWDIHSPSWESEPALVPALLDRLRRSPEDASPHVRHQRLRQRREAAAGEVRAALEADPEALGQFEAALRSAHLFMPARERTKTNAVTFINEVRMAALELGRRGVRAGRFAEPADVMMLLEPELDDYLTDPDGLAEVIARRLREYRSLHEIEPPFIISREVPPLSSWPRRDRVATTALAQGDLLTGVPGGHGTYQGRVRVIRDLAGLSALQPGEVLVAPLSDAAWTPLFMVAGAVVVDVGATNSHAVVVCRELDLPCVVSATGATERLRDGMLVTVDGDAGRVTVDEPAPQLI